MYGYIMHVSDGWCHYSKGHRSKFIDKESNNKSLFVSFVHILQSYISGTLGDMEVNSWGGSIATVYEDVIFKDSGQIFPKETEVTFQAKAKGNEYLITTNLQRYKLERSNFIDSEPHHYLNKLYLRNDLNNQLSACNSGKPTNIDDYLELFQQQQESCVNVV